MAAGTISSIPLPCQYLSMTSLLATVLLRGVPGGDSAGHVWDHAVLLYRAGPQTHDKFNWPEPGFEFQ